MICLKAPNHFIKCLKGVSGKTKCNETVDCSRSCAAAGSVFTNQLDIVNMLNNYFANIPYRLSRKKC